MKKKWKVVLLILAVGILVYFFVSLHSILQKKVTTMSYPNFNKVIIIDAGHGGVDPGKVGIQGSHEKDLNLQIAQKLRCFIEESGGVVILTRSQDVGLYTEDLGTLRDKKNEDLRNRRKLIQESNGDLFISIHLNSFSSPKYYGAQTFYPEGDGESKVLAEIVQEKLKDILNRGNTREAKSADSYYILKENPVPSILIEGGFISNPEEERLLNDESYQTELAWAIYSGLMNYFDHVETISR